MNSLLESIKKFEESSEFKNFKEKYPNSFLTSTFMNLNSEEELELAPWELNYYDQEEQKAHSFLISKDITVREPDKMFSKDKKILKLDLNEVKINLNDALKKVKELFENKYKNESPKKIIIILQKIEETTLWNFTYISSTLNVINIRIDAINGEIVHDTIENVLNFKQNLQ